MKLQISKNSILKCAILTLASLLCFVGVMADEQIALRTVIVKYTTNWGSAHTVTTLTDGIAIKTGSSGDMWGNENTFTFSSKTGEPINDIVLIGNDIKYHPSWEAECTFKLSKDGNGKAYYKGKWNGEISEFTVYTIFSDGILYYSSSPINLGPKINSVSVTPPNGISSGSLFCNNSYTLTADPDYENPASGYPTYLWEYSSNGSTWSNATGTNNVSTYSATSAGYYRVTVAVDAGDDKKKTSSPFQLKAPAPKITTTTNSLSFEHGYNCTSSAQTVAATYDGACSTKTINATITGSAAGSFSLSGSNGSFSVNLAQNATIGNHSATLVLSADGASSVSIPLTGTVPTPVINTDKSSLSFENHVGCTSVLDSKTITPTLNNTCASFTAEITDDPNDNYDVSVSGNTVTVTFKKTATPGSSYTGNLVIHSTGAADKVIPLSGTIPTPTLSLSSSTLDIMNENGATPQPQTITVTRTNSCASVTANSNSTDFSVVKVDDNTFKITYNNNTYDEDATPATGTITFSSDGATSQTLTVEGSVSACSETPVAKFDFGNQSPFENSVAGSSVKFATGLSESTHDYDNSGYAIKSTSHFQNSKDPVGGTGNVFVAKADNDATMFTISGLDPSLVYSISMTAGSNTNRYSGDVTTTFTVGTKTFQVIKSSDESKIIKIEDYVLSQGISSFVVKAKTEGGSNSGNHVYFDDIVITKLCPPDVKMTVADECTEGAMTFTAQATAMSGNSITSYQWYKDSVAISGATSATFTPAITYAKGSLITVKVTDDLGMTAESKPYEYDCGATIESVTLDATSDFYCAGMTLTANAIVDCDDPYPQYEWYKDNVLVGTTTSSTYTVSGSGSWKVIAYASADKYKESSAVVIGEENPTLSLNQTNLSFENLLNNPVAPAQQIIPSVEGSCSAYTYSYTSTNSNFSVDANGNVVFNNNTGTSTIYNGTVEVTATPVGGGNPLTATVDVSGILRDCVPENVVSDGDFESGLPSWITIPFTTTQRTEASQSDADFFAITTKNLNNGCGAFPSGYVGNVLQVHRQTNDQSYDALKITLTDDIDDNTIYSISFTMGNNAKNGSNNAYEILVLGENIGSLPRNTTQTFTFTASGTQLKSGVVVTIKTNASQSDVRNSAYFDNIQIESTCPPKVEITDANSICSSTPSITSSVIIKGSADIEKYEWYVKGVSDSDFSLLESHTSSSLTDTYSSSSEIASGSLIKVVVYDKNGSKAEVLYEVLCGPIIDPIDPINTICVSGNITDLEVPNYESTTSVSTEGWEVASSPDAIGSEWTPLASLNNIPVEYKDYYIRYYAVNEQGKGKSNAVQITMFDDPTIGDFSIENICDGETFTLTGKKPTVEYDDGIENPTERWEYSTTSDFSSGVGILTESTSLAPNTYYVRYVASECKDFYSEVKEVEVYTPHIEVKYANDTYYRTASSLLPITEEPTLEHPCVTGPFTYAIASGNENGYFTIEPTTGVISLTETAKSAPVDGYDITVTATNGTITSEPTPLTITISNDPELTLDCTTSETYYVYSKYQKLEIDKELSSAYVNADVTLELTGNASNFELSSSSVPKNSVQHVSISNIGDFSSAGTYTITLTATTVGEGSLSKACTMSVIVEDLSLSSEKNDQMVCGGIAETLSVSVTGEDQTNLPLSYQWYKGTTAVAGATNKDFTPTEDGNYSCKVSLDGVVIYTSEVSEVKFAPNSPIVTFKGTVPDEVYCSQEIPLELSIVDKNNNDLSSLYKMFTWEMDNTLMRVTSNGKNTFTFDCSQDAGKSVELSVTFSDPDNGCEYVVSKTVSVKAFDKVYYYCGSTGSSSNLTDVNNWCTAENANTSSCTHPSNFTTAGCEYIINKNGVELLSGQTWNVGGDGTKITAGNGIWENNVTSVNGWSQSGIKSNNSDKGLKLSIGNGEYWKENTSEKLGNVARTDYRSVAQTVKISGTMNLADGVSIDVTAGTNLEIATNLGNPTIGNCTVDELVVNDNSNMWVRPGSMVTYSGAGAEKIQDVTYSNIFINTSGDVTFPKGVVEVKQTLKYDQTPASVTTTGNTVLYSGAVDQLIEPMTYNNLDAENATYKTLGGNVTVNGALTVGSGATLDGGTTNNVLTMTGSGDVMNYNGKFKAGNSTVRYTNSASTEIEALHYYNLDISGGERVLPNGGTVGIAGTFTPSENAIVTGSTVEFDGKTPQMCPEFNYNNLIINNTAELDAIVTMQGDVNVGGRLILSNGVLKTQGKTLTVTNSSANAVGGGSSKSYIDGSLTWNLPENANGSDISTQYLFPVGTYGKGYSPLILTSLTTGSSPSVTIGVTSGNALTAGSGISNVSDLAWTVQGNNYTSGSVSLYNTASAYNVIGYTNDVATPVISKGGSKYGSDLLRSNTSGMGYYTLASADLTKKTYYYNCKGDNDITSIGSWFTAENGGGDPATSFTEEYATWVIKCDAAITKNSLTITGSNVIVRLENKAKLTVNNNVVFSELAMGEGSNLDVSANGEISILNSITMAGKSTNTHGNFTTITNNGTINLYAPSLILNKGATIINEKNAHINMVGTDLSIYDSEVQRYSDHDYKMGHFINRGEVSMKNGVLYMEGISAQLKNEKGAVWIVDNSAAPNKTITFKNVDFQQDNATESYVDLECGSTFYVKNSDVEIYYYHDDGNSGLIGIAGDLIVEDGNLKIKRDNQGGGHFTIQQSCGDLIVNDTDNSGDGLLEIVGTGGSGVHIAGTMYVMGIITETVQSGNTLEIKDGGFAFIGNLGAVMSQNSWDYTIAVQDGGTLYYCGNRTAGRDNVGQNKGYMCYASSYYSGGADDPIHQGDFTSPTPGTYRACFESMESCQAAFDVGVEKKTGTLLPIELTMLHAVCNENNEVEIRWQTASETNNEYFTILRSFDGVHFEELDIVWGAGTTTEFHNYEYFDTDDNTGIVYYKLRQTDYDGNTTESKVIAVQTCGPNAQFRITEDQIDIFFNHPEESSFVVITSITGQIFYSKSFRNTEAARIAAPQRKGIYIISVIDSKTITSEKFIR